MKTDTWVGLRKYRMERYWDNDTSLRTPLQMSDSLEKSYTDQTFYDTKFSFHVGLRDGKWEGPCLFLQAAANMEQTIETPCSKEKGFICEWISKIQALTLLTFQNE